MPWFKRKGLGGSSWVCPICGTTHAGLPTDFGWLLPDAAWNTDEQRRKAMLDWSTDLCYFENKWYVRGVLQIPFTFNSQKWGWGIWVEVEEQTLDNLKRAEIAGLKNQIVGEGTIASQIPLHHDSSGLKVEIKTLSPNLRPLFILPHDSQHPLASEQRLGINEEQLHNMLRATQK